MNVKEQTTENDLRLPNRWYLHLNVAAALHGGQFHNQPQMPPVELDLIKWHQMAKLQVEELIGTN